MYIYLNVFIIYYCMEKAAWIILFSHFDQMKIRVWGWVNDPRILFFLLLVDYPFKTQIGLSYKILKFFNWRQFCHSNFNLMCCHTSLRIFFSSRLSRWQHRKWETVLRTVSWLNQLEEVCLLPVCKENLMSGDMDLDELLPERNAALYAKNRLIPWKGSF